MRIAPALLLPTLLLPTIAPQSSVRAEAQLLPIQASRRPDPAASQAETQRLLDALARAPDGEAASAIEAQIRRLWAARASPAAALLMQRAARNMEARAYADAVEDLDAAITLQADDPRSWVLRGQAQAALGDRRAAALDLREALRLEPRQFDALLALSTLQQDSGDLAKAVAHGVFQTLAFNPVPQFYQPIRELQANRNFFFDTPIEDMSDEGKLPEARYDERTSALSRSLGQVTGPSIGVSPKQLDHLVRGYTGTLGGYVLSVSNLIAGIGSDAERPAATAGDIPVIKVIYSGETVKSTQYQTEFYDMMQEAEQLHRTIRSYTEEGKMDEARELFEENRDKLRHRPALGFARKQLGNVRKQMDAVYRDTSMDAAAKREKLNALQERANAIAKRVTELAGEDF